MGAAGDSGNGIRTRVSALRGPRPSPLASPGRACTTSPPTPGGPRAQGARPAFWTPEPAADGTVAALHERLGLAVNPVVPNMRAYLRDASDYGVVGAVFRRFRRLRLADQ